MCLLTYRQDSQSHSNSPRLNPINRNPLQSSCAQQGSPPILGSSARRKKQPRLSSQECFEIAGRTPSPSNATPSARAITEFKDSADEESEEEEESGEDTETMSVTSSEYSSTEDSSVDMDTTSLSPTPDSPTSVIASLPDTPKVKHLKGRRAMSSTNNSGMFAVTRKQQDQNGVEDVDSSFTTSLPAFRSRMATFGGQMSNMVRRPNAAPGRHQINKGGNNGGGDKAESSATGDVTQASARLQRRNSYPLAGQRSVGMYELDLLSPDMEMKMEQLIFIALEKKYGGKEKATRAATIIQTAYRKYKNIQHYKLLRERQQTTMQRRRTMSVKHPGGRRPSMIKKKNRTVNGTTQPVVDQMTQVKTLYRNITQPKLSPNVSRREILATSPLMTAAKVSSNSLVTESVAIEMDDPLETTPIMLGGLTNQLSMIDESEDEDVHEELETGIKGRSHSIFSGMSSSTIQKLFSANHPIIVQQKESASTFRKKMTVGANIFNRLAL